MSLFKFRFRKSKDDGKPVEPEDSVPPPAEDAPDVAAEIAAETAATPPAQTVTTSTVAPSADTVSPATAAPSAPVVPPATVGSPRTDPIAPHVAEAPDKPAESAAGRQRGLLARLRAKLNRGNSWLTYDLANLLPGGKIDDTVLDELETRLIAADVGIETTERILGSLRKRVQRKELADLTALLGALRSAMLEILAPVAVPLVIDGSHRPYVVLVVGVNGSGKTTTIGKLARRFTSEGRKVVLAAGDTFRAAAIEQLQIWGERNNVPVIAQGVGADPAAVTFDALQSAQARGADILIADTAGRLHTQSNLMAELKKVKRVLTRLDATAPHEVLLVLDASQGQNALAQAQQFQEAVGVTGLVMTKLDGTAKGGIVLAIAAALHLPIRYIGVGETAEDFSVFDAAAFVDAVLAPPRNVGDAAA
jgi:fused signal recognition particle receptor